MFLKSVKLIGIGAAILLLTGCGGAKLTPQQIEEAKNFDTSKIDTFKERLHKGINEDELLFYAPYSVKLAKEYYEKAQGSKNDAEKVAAFMQAEKALQNGYETKKLVKKYLSDVQDLKERMIKQNTQAVYKSRYEDFMDDYGDLIELIDKREITKALEEKKDVMSDGMDLYGDAVVYRNINEAYLILDRMEDDDLDELAPNLFEQAERVYEESVTQIKKEPDNKELVAKLAKKTNNLAKFAETIAKEVYDFRELKEDEQEAYFVKLHKRVASLNPNEDKNPILHLPMFEKITYLEEINKVAPSKKRLPVAENSSVTIEKDEVETVEKSESSESQN